MRTEADLRAALATLERHAPDADAVLAAVRPRRHAVSRRSVLVAAAAAAGVAAIPVTARLTARRNDGPPSAPARMHPLRTNFTVEPFDGYRVAAIKLEPEKQQVRLQRAETEHVFVTVYEPGLLDAAPISGGDPVTVAGRRGFYLSEPVRDLPTGDPFTGVFWEYAPSAWANASNLGMAGEREIVLRVAADVRFGVPMPLQVPYRIGRLPAGWRPVSGARDTVGPDLSERTTDVMVATDRDGSVNCSAGPAAYLPQGSPPTTAPIGEPVVVRDPAPFVLINFGSFGVTLVPSDKTGEAEPPIEQLIDVARSITPTADFGDLAAWFDATEVFPAG